MIKKSLLGMNLEELKAAVTETGLPAFAAKQVARWIYVQHVGTIDEMTNISLKNREALKEHFDIGCATYTDCQCSTDGTKKYLFPTQNGQLVESVYIPDGERATLCVSSQVGCRMGCRFCMTGRQGFQGNLSTTEILNQIYSLPERDTLTNVVFMGQGEPMDNINAVLKATQLLTVDYGYAWSPKRITVSTIGVMPVLERFLEESRCHLAVSLHNPFPEERFALMPVQKAYPIQDVIALIRQYDFTGQRRVSFEYTMFAGHNDTPRHADALLRLLHGLECRVNLIRFHRIPDFPYGTSPQAAMEAFRDRLARGGITATIRASRGEDIFAACGLLAGQHNHA